MATWRARSILAALPVGVIAIHGRQVLHLLLGDVEPDTVVEPSYFVERDSHFLVTPQVPLFEEHVGHLVGARVDAERLSDFSGE